MLAPTAQDAAFTQKIFREIGHEPTICESLEELCDEIVKGCGVAVLTEEAVRSEGAGCLQEIVQKQPAWSDLPVLILSHSEHECPIAESLVETFGNVTLLDYPVRVTSLISAVRTALRARRRQYQVEEFICERERARQALARVTDSSERERRLYETILSTIPDLVYVFDLNHRFTYANEALLKMWGRSWEEAIGKTCLELGYPDWHAKMHDEEIERVVATKQAVRGEVPFTGTNGTRIYDYIFVPVIGEQGEVEAVAGTTRDVTERKSLEQTLIDQAVQLRETDRRKDEFLAMLAHELRNPLAPLQNALNILQRTKAAGSASVQLQPLMSRQVEHLTHLVDDLLDVSRITTGKIVLKRELLDLSEALYRAIELSRPLFESKNQTFVSAISEEPLLVEGDAVRLVQIFGNILHNASKYTPPDGAISLAVDRVEGDVRIRVTDNGIGLSAEMLPRVFDIFAQADNSLAHASGGLGLGLTLVKRLVEKHGGSVSAASSGLGSGSTFEVRLPLFEDVFRTVPRAQGTPMEQETTPKKILVVDDNKDSADSIAALLSIFGHTVKAVYSGPEVIDLVVTFEPDVVLLDIGLPGESGYDIAKRIRNELHCDQVILVAMTGYGRDEDRLLSKEAGFDAHLVKPVDFEVLERILRSVNAGEVSQAV